jgi:hypothetical protein
MSRLTKASIVATSAELRDFYDSDNPPAPSAG